MIDIWEPRYHDKKVLVANYRIPSRGDIDIKISKGYYAGKYTIARETIANSPIEQMKTKKGGTVDMRVIPIDKLQKKEEQ